MICKQCEKNNAREGSKYCSTLCRNFNVSERMIKKAKAAKKEFGNDYYINGFKKEEPNG